VSEAVGVPGSRFPIVVQPVRTPADLADLRTLFIEYGASLGDHLDQARFAIELAALPGDYAPPGGALLLARVGDAPAGCVGLRPLQGAQCELKRMYTRSQFRGQGIGRQLLDAALSAARAAGYTAIRLDSLSTMKEAQGLYARLGFREIPPYRPDQTGGMRCMELML
jgi:ribosomal protein S18 acetylase RimI-like enzyme